MSNIPENNLSKKSNQNQKQKSKSNKTEEEIIIIKYINELKDENKRTKAISKLSEYYDKNYNLAIYLWYSQGTIAILLQEIISSYKYLSSSKISMPSELSSKICDILRLFTCIASHKELKYKFVESKIPIFLYPFLNSTSNSKYNEYPKLLSITVISYLIQTEDPNIISFFINTELTPILLKIVDKGSSLSKIPVCMMIHIILKNYEGLKYICEGKVRYSAIIIFMRHMLKNKNNDIILKTILKIFIRLAENSDVRNILRNNILKEIKDPKFTRHLNDSSKNLHSILLKILNTKETKDEGNKNKENNKDINKNNNNNNEKNINNNNNYNINNNNQQININNNNADLMNQYNNLNTNNIMLVNQLNQMKLSPQPYMNYSDVNNYKMYNGNENYLNKINYIGNQNNNNKGFVNMNYYNIYKSS